MVESVFNPQIVKEFRSMLETLMNKLENRFNNENPLSYQEWKIDPAKEDDVKLLRAALIARSMNWAEGTIEETFISLRQTGYGRIHWTSAAASLRL